jgi:hypothetical protein
MARVGAPQPGHVDHTPPSSIRIARNLHRKRDHEVEAAWMQDKRAEELTTETLDVNHCQVKMPRLT